MAPLSPFRTHMLLVMEQAKSRHGHRNAIFIARFDDIIIANRTASLSNIIDTAAMSPFDIIAKWEECIAPKSYAVELGNPSFLFFPC